MLMHMYVHVYLRLHVHIDIYIYAYTSVYIYIYITYIQYVDIHYVYMCILNIEMYVRMSGVCACEREGGRTKSSNMKKDRPLTIRHS